MNDVVLTNTHYALLKTPEPATPPRQTHTTMKPHQHHLRLRLYCRTTAVTTTSRHYATKYTAKVTSTSPTGRSLTAEVTPLRSPYPTDIRGYPLPRRDVICKATHILLHHHTNQSRPSTSPRSNPNPFLDLSNYLHSLALPLTPSEASEILKSLNHPSLALNFFRLCPSLSPNFQHDSFTYTRLILILSKSSSPDRFDLVRSLLSQMDQSNTRGTISTVNILIGFFGNSQDLDLCMSLIKKWNLTMNSYTYKCLLQAYLRSHDSDKAFHVFTEMRRRGYKLDIFAYNMLLDALAKDEKVCVTIFPLVLSFIHIWLRFCRNFERANMICTGRMHNA
jgi:pentatricopeptide repeat protein